MVVQQRKEARLRAALALYKLRAHADVIARFRNSAPILDWPDQTPLGEVVEQIQFCTRRGWPMFPLGVPIVVDPAGLQATGKSLTSPVQRPPADQELSLARKLRAVLEPLGLACNVKDAAIIITARAMVGEPVYDEDDE